MFLFSLPTGPDADMFQVLTSSEKNSGYLSLRQEIQNNATAFSVSVCLYKLSHLR